MIQLASGLGKRTVAEFVSDQEALDLDHRVRRRLRSGILHLENRFLWGKWSLCNRSTGLDLSGFPSARSLDLDQRLGLAVDRLGVDCATIDRPRRRTEDGDQR